MTGTAKEWGLNYIKNHPDANPIVVAFIAASAADIFDGVDIEDNVASVVDASVDEP